MKLTKQEQTLIRAYRDIEAEWERLALALLIKSMAWGRLTKKTDSYSVKRMRRLLIG